MQYTVRELAELVQGQVVGDGDLVIHGFRTLKNARPGDITFIEQAKYLPQLAESRASAAVTPPQLADGSKTLIVVADPLQAFVRIVRHLQGKSSERPTGIDSRAEVHPSVALGADVSIGPFVSIGAGSVLGQRCQLHPGVVIGENCRLGDDVTLHPNVVLYEDTILGNRVIIHAGSVIGADGFGYRFHQGQHVKVPQLSHVIVGNDVEIGACTTIDRGTFEPTTVGDGTKIDNHVMIGHNCTIGKHNLLIAQAGLGGSSSTGQYVTLAGQVGVADHVHIGDGTIAAGQTGITHNVAPGSQLMGFPARPVRDQRRIIIAEQYLPEMRRDLQRIKKQLGLADEAAA